MESITGCAAVNYRSTLGIRGQNLYSKDTVLNHFSEQRYDNRSQKQIECKFEEKIEEIHRNLDRN